MNLSPLVKDAWLVNDGMNRVLLEYLTPEMPSLQTPDKTWSVAGYLAPLVASMKWWASHVNKDEADRLPDLYQRTVEAGQTHAALAFDGDETVAWAPFGTVAELPNIHRKQWEAETEVQPDYLITCVVVAKRYRRKGLAAVAVRGALELIARQGGGLVKAYPHDLAAKKKAGKKVSSSFLYNATRTMYAEGFTYLRPKGQGNCVMSKRVAAAQP